MHAHWFDSKTGNIFVIVYALSSIVLAGVSFFCSSQACGMLLLVPILPWAVILEQQLSLSLPWGVYPFLLLINTIVVYAIGVTAEHFYQSIRRKR